VVLKSRIELEYPLQVEKEIVDGLFVFALFYLTDLGPAFHLRSILGNFPETESKACTREERRSTRK